MESAQWVIWRVCLQVSSCCRPARCFHSVPSSCTPSPSSYVWPNPPAVTETPGLTWVTSWTSPAGFDTSRSYSSLRAWNSFLCSAGECSHCTCLCWQVSGTRGPLGSSNIQESGLPFDLSVFKSLLQIEVQGPNMYSSYLMLHTSFSIRLWF